MTSSRNFPEFPVISRYFPEFRGKNQKKADKLDDIFPEFPGIFQCLDRSLSFSGATSRLLDPLSISSRGRSEREDFFDGIFLKEFFRRNFLGGFFWEVWGKKTKKADKLNDIFPEFPGISRNFSVS